MLGKPARGKPCEAVNGIIEEANEIAQDFRGSEALDAGLIAAQQAVKSWAQELGLQEAIPLLAQTLKEETKTDRILTQLAESRVNEQAAAVVAE